MLSIHSLKTYIGQALAPSIPYISKTSALVNNLFSQKKDDSIVYEDRTNDGKLISSTRVRFLHPENTYKEFKHHKSLQALSEKIALARNPKASGKTLKKETLNASFSSRNRGDLVTEVKISKGLKSLLGLQGKSDQEVAKLLEVKSIYKHNSEFNGNSYTDSKGNLIQIHSATSSSADRKAEAIQNLSVIKAAGKNIAYTGRPDSLSKAKEQAVFILSNKLNLPLEEASSSEQISEEMPIWLKGKKGIIWNEKTKCIELPYAVYSIMSDSDSMYLFYNTTGSWENNEKRFLKKEIQTLKQLPKEPVLVKDGSGKVYKLQCKPILLSQGFNAFSSIKGFSAEGSLSPIVMFDGWCEICKVLKRNPKKMQKLENHIQKLNSYFAGKTYLSPLHLFLHMNIVLSEINGPNESLPIILHCKSSTDRTGIGAAILSTLAQFKTLKIPIPDDMEQLTADTRFKELFVLNWLPTWHQRSKYSRDVEGISFGSGLFQNPNLLECLPKRYLTEKSNNSFRYLKSGLFALTNLAFLGLYKNFKVSIPFSCDITKALLGVSPLSYKWYPIVCNSKIELETLCYYPNVFLNEKANKYLFKGKVLSPIKKEEESDTAKKSDN